jgi:hypothetical protein
MSERGFGGSRLTRQNDTSRETVTGTRPELKPWRKDGEFVACMEDAQLAIGRV